jgi:hypothetical protein
MQTAKKHSKYIPGFHVLTFGVFLAAFLISIILVVHRGFSHETVFYFLTAFCLGLLFLYTRRFATLNQDRIIRAEENFRCYRLTGKILDPALTRNQIIALRFADDSEYADLSAKAISQKLDPKAIKELIQQWRADHHRV